MMQAGKRLAQKYARKQEEVNMLTLAFDDFVEI